MKYLSNVRGEKNICKVEKNYGWVFKKYQRLAKAEGNK